MQTFFLITLFIFGLLFGSFSSVIIYRIKSKEGGILTGRSHCSICKKTLKIIDLIPLFSWIISLGKCRYCKTKIAKLYPILELSNGILFTLIGYFLINYNLIFLGNINEIIKLVFWLIIGFISIIYIFYDILFFEISERILASGVFVAVIGIIIETYSKIDIFPYYIGDALTLSEKNISIAVLLITIAGLYTIILKNLAEIFDIIILILLFFIIYLFNGFFVKENILAYYPAISASIGAISIFSFFFIQILISRGRWMGGGDLRIAILIGLLVGHFLAFPSMMLTYMVGSIIGIGFIIYQKIKNFKTKKQIQTQVPFGPFIAVGFFITIFFQKEILYKMLSFFYF